MTVDAELPEEVMWAGRFIEARRRGRWEYATRPRGISAVVIVAIEDGHVLLIEQERVPLDRRCLELPAGLVGDVDAGETVEASAARELEEETGYRAARIVPLGEFHSSPGMTDERFTLVRATGLTRVSVGGGDGDEQIVVQRVPVGAVPAFVAARRAAGLAIDVKLLLLLAGDVLTDPA